MVRSSHFKFTCSSEEFSKEDEPVSSSHAMSFKTSEFARKADVNITIEV